LAISLISYPCGMLLSLQPQPRPAGVRGGRYPVWRTSGSEFNRRPLAVYYSPFVFAACPSPSAGLLPRVVALAPGTPGVDPFLANQTQVMLQIRVESP